MNENEKAKAELENLESNICFFIKILTYIKFYSEFKIFLKKRKSRFFRRKI